MGRRSEAELEEFLHGRQPQCGSCTGFACLLLHVRFQLPAPPTGMQAVLPAVAQEDIVVELAQQDAACAACLGNFVLQAVEHLRPLLPGECTQWLAQRSTVSAALLEASDCDLCVCTGFEGCLPATTLFNCFPGAAHAPCSHRAWFVG